MRIIDVPVHMCGDLLCRRLRVASTPATFSTAQPDAETDVKGKVHAGVLARGTDDAKASLIHPMYNPLKDRSTDIGSDFFSSIRESDQDAHGEEVRDILIAFLKSTMFSIAPSVCAFMFIRSKECVAACPICNG